MSPVSVTRPPSPIVSASSRRECEGELVAAYASHAAAAAAGRRRRSSTSTDRFERLGARLLAAESATEAAQAFQRHGDRRAAARWASERRRWPGLRRGPDAGPDCVVMVVPLTARERDIATLAAQGESSKAIAERLFLSVRTVNNHLQNVYSKLGVTGRRQLADALEPTGVSAAGGPFNAPAIIVSAVRL